MSDVPDVAGGDVQSFSERHTALEQENALKVQRLMTHGLTEQELAGHLIPARLEALVSVMPTPIRQELELRYEQAVGVVLDQLYDRIAPKLYVAQAKTQ